MPVFKPKGQRNYRIQFDINGRTYVKSAKTSDKRAAEKMEAQWRAKIHSQKMIGELEDISLDQMFDDYLARPHAETTLKNARSFRRLLTAFLKKQGVSMETNAHEFEQAYLDKFIQYRLASGTAQSTIRTQMLYFSGAWNQTNRKVYNVPDLEYTKLKQPKQKTEYVTPDEEDSLVLKLTTRKPHAAGTGDWQHESHDVLVMLRDTAKQLERSLIA